MHAPPSMSLWLAQLQSSSRSYKRPWSGVLVLWAGRVGVMSVYQRSAVGQALSAWCDPAAVKTLSAERLVELAAGNREFRLGMVSALHMHLGRHLGVVETTLALHQVIDWTKYALIFDWRRRTTWWRTATPRPRRPARTGWPRSARSPAIRIGRRSRSSAALSTGVRSRPMWLRVPTRTRRLADRHERRLPRPLPGTTSYVTVGGMGSALPSSQSATGCSASRRPSLPRNPASKLLDSQGCQHPRRPS
ncbi:1-deoxy-D-xylulose-5-phosphate synthase N-terminal domain-containing protein [Streptomyces sp. CA-251387]|uniref:1-deoxy-D-xylulose-5-phosphate synthase N-terminal domain-containing protein n=1 Tax=Streptomyces sp. CA-251387 TaxID=3240064 RepID=UPI003D9194FD